MMLLSLFHLSILVVVLILSILLSGLDSLASDVSKVNFSVKLEASPVLRTMVCIQCFLY